MCESAIALASIGLLLEMYSWRQVELIDEQMEPPLIVSDAVTGEQSQLAPAGPEGLWIVVRFRSGEEYAVWKHTGAIYRVQSDGSVGDDPLFQFPVGERDWERRDWFVRPGELLREWADDHGMGILEIASACQIPPERVQELLSGAAMLDGEPEALERCTGVTAAFWRSLATGSQPHPPQ